MSDLDLTSVIEDAVSDAELPVETEVEAPEVEASSEEVSESSETVDTEVSEDFSEVEVGSPATRQQAVKPDQDEFEKKFGIPQQGASGRENRIPHSRVQKIVAKAEKEVEGKYLPKLQEWETKWAEQEVRNQKVAQFEEVMVNDPARFIQTLHDNLPQYRELLGPLYAPRPVAQNEQAAAEQVDGMPGPDLEHPDGSLVYSEGGLKNLINWAISQGETRAVKTLEERYAPIEQSFQNYQYIQTVSQKVQNEIAEAQKWPLFKEHENDIVEALKKDQRLSLEGAYRQVVWPRMTADRNKIREEVIAELKKAPASTAAPRAAARANVRPAGNGPRSLEDVIRESVEGAGLK